ncbi:hypothetical protein T484DRAFT_1866342 [Baffinella frigidus]|nr:hypothetical protein T484DRAFT_1866342 [Cryptophyta sp. CCMP2293]
MLLQRDNISEMLLQRDNISVFQDAGGRPSRKYGLCWTEPPTRPLLDRASGRF